MTGAIPLFSSGHGAQRSCDPWTQGDTDTSARTITHNQANAIELATIRPLAHALARLFQPTSEVPFTTSADKWAQLRTVEFWTIALISEMRRYNREQSEAPLAGDEDLRFLNRGVVNIHTRRKITTPPLTLLPLPTVHIYFPIGYLDTVLQNLAAVPSQMLIEHRVQGR